MNTMHSPSYLLRTAAAAIAILAATCTLKAQQPVVYNGKSYTDSAVMVVERYLDILNYKALSNDSTLHITCAITKRSTPADTLYMHHWHAAPEYYMTEIVYKGRRLLAYYRDGYGTFQRYNKETRQWDKLSEMDYEREASAYDFHSPLYEWESGGITLRYDGEWDYNGHRVYRVYAQAKTRHDRYYIFEKQSGLLFFIDELDTRNGTAVEGNNIDQIDWRAYEEYQPIGNCIMPSIEVYQQNGDITRIQRKFEYIGKDLKRFTDVNLR